MQDVKQLNWCCDILDTESVELWHCRDIEYLCGLAKGEYSQTHIRRSVQ